MGGVIDFIVQKNIKSPVFIFNFLSRFSCVAFVCFSGGILGWDPVHTTCIPGERMMKL